MRGIPASAAPGSAFAAGLAEPGGRRLPQCWNQHSLQALEPEKETTSRPNARAGSATVVSAKDTSTASQAASARASPTKSRRSSSPPRSRSRAISADLPQMTSMPLSARMDPISSLPESASAKHRLAPRVRACPTHQRAKSPAPTREEWCSPLKYSPSGAPGSRAATFSFASRWR